MKWLSGFLIIAGLVIFLFGVGFGFLYGWNTGLPTTIAFAHLGIGAALVVAGAVSIGAEGFRGAGKLALGRTSAFTFHLLAYGIGFIGILVLINIFAHRYDHRWDLSEEGVYSLTSQSSKVITGLQKPLKLVALRGNPSVSDQEIERLFELYRFANRSKVTTEFINPRAKPHLVEQYDMKPGNVIYLEYGDGDSISVSRINDATEEAMTNAVIKLTRGVSKKIYVLEGHGGPAIKSSSPDGLEEFSSALKDEHFTVEGLVLSSMESVPADAAAVLVINPRSAMLAQEKQMLKNYADNGGRLLLVTDLQSPPDIAELADYFGIEVRSDVVLDRMPRVIGGSPAHLVTRNWGTHELGKGMGENHIVLFRLASSLAKKASAEGSGATLSEIVSSETSTWGETNLNALFNSEKPTAALEENDHKGPLPLAMAYEKALGGEKSGETQESADEGFKKVSRVVVVGDSDWIINENLPVLANRDFGLNLINWLAGEEGGISIRPRSIRASLAPIGTDTLHNIFVLSNEIPLLFLLGGLLIWWRRRSVENA